MTIVGKKNLLSELLQIKKMNDRGERKDGV